MRRHTIIDSPVGPLTAVAEDDALIALYFERHGRAPAVTEHGERADEDPLLIRARTQLGEYFGGERRSFDLPTDPPGDGFQQRVWAQLREIPYGETRSYGELAAALGDRNLARRVGQSVGRNPVSIVIPCHRVLGAGGALTGYAGGLPRKQALLELEGALLRMP